MHLNSKLNEIVSVCENLGLEISVISMKEQYIRTSKNKRYTFEELLWRFKNIEENVIDEKPLSVHTKFKHFYITRKKMLEYKVSDEFIFFAQSLYSIGESEFHSERGLASLKPLIESLGFTNLEFASQRRLIEIFKRVIINMKYNKDILNENFSDIEEVIQLTEHKTRNNLNVSTNKIKLIRFMEILQPNSGVNWNDYTKIELFDIFIQTKNKIVFEENYCIM